MEAEGPLGDGASFADEPFGPSVREPGCNVGDDPIEVPLDGAGGFAKRREPRAGRPRDPFAELLARDVGLEAIEDRGERLTLREWDVLRNLASGKTNAQIATGLFVTEGTVNFHLRNIFRKLGASSKHQAVLKALRMRLI